MSSLWTPSGEHPVDRPASGPSAEQPPAPSAASRTQTAAPPAGPRLDQLSPEERAEAEELAREVDKARQQLLDMPAGPVVGQQALQFYELAVLHLSQPEPRLDDARVAIDALGAVVDTLGARLGEAEAPLRQALNQLRLAFVDATRGQGGSPPPDAEG